MSKLLLHTFRIAATPLYAAGTEPPKRLVVLPWGKNPSRRGDFVVNEQTARVFAENQLKNRLDGKLALDFEHNTLPGTPAYEGSAEPRPIAAWALCKVIPGEGVVYDDIEWTPDGLSAWERKLYQDLSPAPVRGADGKTVIAMHSTALCRHGELVDLTIAHAAAPKALAAYFDALSADLTLNPCDSPSMKAKLILLLAALGVTLAPDADEATTEAALDTALQNAKKEETPAGEKGDGGGRMTSKPEAMSAEVADLRKEMDALRKEAVISEALRAGKVIPLSATAIEATPLSAIKELVANAKPGEVSTQKKTVDGKEVSETEDKPEALSADLLAMGASMGLTEEDLKKAAS